MGTTAKGLSYPDPGDPVNEVDLQIKDLANDVDALLPMANLLTVSAIALTRGVNWDATALIRGTEFRAFNKQVAWLDFTATRKAATATVTAGNAGSINPGRVNPTELVATITNAADRPLSTQYLMGAKTSFSTWALRVLSTGVIEIFAAHQVGTAGVAIAPGDTLQVQGLIQLK